MGEASIIDVIRLLCPEASGEYAVQMFTRILEKDDRVTSIESCIKDIKINGCGRTTPVADLDTLVEVLWMLPSVASRALRRESVEAVFRAMRGDLGLCRQIEQNNLVRGAVEGGEAIRQALLQPVEYREDGESTRVKESPAREALASLIGGEREVKTPSGFVDMHSDAVIEMEVSQSMEA